MVGGAILADDFTDDNVRVAAAAILNYVREREDAKHGICIGYDTRFMSQRFAGIVAESAAAAGVPVTPGRAALLLPRRFRML